MAWNLGLSTCQMCLQGKLYIFCGQQAFISSKRPSKLMPERDKKEGRKVKFAIEPGLLPSRNGGMVSAQKNKEASDVCTCMQ